MYLHFDLSVKVLILFLTMIVQPFCTVPLTQTYQYSLFSCRLDVMEALDVAMGVVFISAVFGQDVWTGTIQVRYFYSNDVLFVVL